jgi:xanthine dehydrogenase small subunit
MRDHILFHVNGHEFRVTGRQIYTTLANWLRYDEGATGTKIVCEEGDCGACTVLIRRSADEQFAPVNSCIQILAQMDGASIVTVEGLKDNGALTALQESMVVCHGAQCGYCTPGFVVAMSALYETCDRVTEKQVREGLTGNLCRCTGYEPIIKAAIAVNGAEMRKLRDRYAAIPDARDAVRIENFYAPATIEEAVKFKAEHPGCTIVQGATDVGVWMTKRHFTSPSLLFLGKITALNAIQEENGHIAVGANVTLSRFESFIADRIPELHRILNIFGSPQIRNAGTLAGNIANGSPIGDTIPYLFVSDAQLELAGTSGTRLVSINSFYRGYKQFDLKPDEIITRVFVPVVKDTIKLYKVSRRKDLDISAFTAAIRLKMNGHIEEARIAYGGVAPTVIRLPKTEEFLKGKTPALDVFERAGDIARSEIKPISDVRGSADYRLLLAKNIMCKFFYEVVA